MKNAMVLTLVLSLAVWVGVPIRADDTDLFLTDSVEPNVVILLDTSRSMDDSIDGEKKMDSAKQVVANLISSVQGVRFGVFAFNDDSSGARMVAPVGSDLEIMLAEVSAMRADGYTPLGQATDDIQDYFLGLFQEDLQSSDGWGWSAGGHGGNWDCNGGGWSGGGGGGWGGGGWGGGGWGGGGGFGSWAYGDKGSAPDPKPGPAPGAVPNWTWIPPGSPPPPPDPDPDPDPDPWGGGWGGWGDWGGWGTCEEEVAEDEEPLTYPSPIELECQKCYTILVTDGMPTKEDENLVSQVATSLQATDHSDLPGVQNVTVFTVGFNVPEGTELLTRTASNGGGAFYVADNSAELERALRLTLAQIIDDSYSFAAPLVPSTSASEGDKAYIASFQPSPNQPFWKGELRAYRRGSDGQIPVDSDGKPLPSAMVWDAGVRLANRAASDRKIFTEIGGKLQSFETGNGYISAAMLGVSTDTEKVRVIDFVRGVDTYDHDVDKDVTEDRSWKLGDIFHSSPVLVFPPPLRTTDSDYVEFKKTWKDRTAIVLVGANDGMLHAFRAGDGVELWGFVPPDLLDELRLLTPISGSHPYYVDSSPVVVDIKVGSSWKTIAMFGERRGGTRYHALDITDTENPKYMWAFSDSELGETWSEPAIGKVRMDGGTTKFVAFVGGGYDSASNNATGKALFAIDLATGQKLWEYTNAGSGDAKYLNFSVPATPAGADISRDGFIERVYVGDVGGQLWKFDVSAEATLTNGLVDNWTGKLLFAADPNQTNPPPAGEYLPTQAMFGSPTLAVDESGSLWAYVGTGDRYNPKSESRNRFYAVKDETTMANGTSLTESNLVNATSESEAEVKTGWYLVLGANEKVLGSADVYNSTVFFSTYTPETADKCEAAAGTAELYAIRMADGDPAIDWDSGHYADSGTRSTEVGGGLPSDPKVMAGDTADTAIVATTEGEVASISMPPAESKRVRYWREVY